MITTDPDSKAAVRRAALARRKALPPELRLQFTERLVREGLRLARLWRPATVSGFHPIRDEPDALALLGALAADGFAVALPAVVGRDRPLDFRLWRPGDPTAPGTMGILEPLAAAPSVEPDLVFTPLSAFDRAGRRLGYGGGFYDRTLERLRRLKPVRAVGVAYGVCEVASVPYESHDQSLDAIVTDQETIFVGER